MNRWHRMACLADVQIPQRGSCRRLLVGSCWHGLGFRFFEELVAVIDPDVVVCLGDLSGIDPFAIDATVVHAMWNITHPTVYCPGNHDLALVRRVMRLKGAAVLDRPGLVELDGLRLFGWADPNRTRWGHRDPYRPELCRQRAREVELPTGIGPYILAVHDASMVPGTPLQVPLVLCGHAHVPTVWRKGSTVFARTGTAGGGGLQRPSKVTARQAMVVDVELPTHRAKGIWMVESAGKTVSVMDAQAR
jgi:predicted phosphodiesterase